MISKRLTLLLLLAIALLAVTSVVAQESTEECSGQGKKHGNHCHCNKGYKSKGLECVPIDGAAAGASCPVGGIAWELSALVYLEKGSYTIELTKNDDDMATLLLPVVNATEATMEKLEESVERSTQLLEDITLARKLIKDKQVMAPTDKLLYIIRRNNAEELEKLKEECEKTPGNVWHIDHCDGPEGHGRRLAEEKMTVNLTISDSAYYAFHLQHNAVEEFGMQILTGAGQPVALALSKASEEGEEAAEEGSSSGGRKASGAVWGKTMAAVTVVALLSVIGIMLLAIRQSILQRLMDALMALSAGALFGAAFIHILPEAIEFYSVYGQMELSLCMIFTAGFVVAMVLEMFLEVCLSKIDGSGGHHHHHAPLTGRSSALKLLSPSQPATSNENTASGAFVDVETPATNGDAAEKKVATFSLQVDWPSIKPMAYIILMGDLFHNFVDGVLIATAFLACDDALGIAVTVSAILHEVPQEFADFIILIDAGFTTFQAILFNFASALSAYLGAIVILSSVQVTKEAMGMLLGFGAGTLVYIAATDLLPRVLRVEAFFDFFLRIFLFGVGIGVLALTTLYHVHCEVEL